MTEGFPNGFRDRFRDRTQAGRLLAAQVQVLGLIEPLVLAMPRGGVPVALEVARALRAPLDLLMVRKIGAPWQPELAVAAVVDGGQHALVIDDEIAGAAGVEREYIERQAELELQEIERRRVRYLGGRAPLPVAGRTVVLVDDGIATGTSVRAALKALRQTGPRRLVLAVPVAPPSTVYALRGEVDDLVCISQPEDFRAVGLHYEDFHQVEDDEVVAALAAAGGASP